ncbi:hypothetical protein SAMN02910369_03042, partial [Lachnospiraceae bacterium NE2001]
VTAESGVTIPDTAKNFEYTFTLTLGDTSVNGTKGDFEFANGVATFKLTDGQSKTAEGLPLNATYTVEEDDTNMPTGVQLNGITNSTGTIGTTDITVTATNKYTEPQANGSLTISKTISDAPLNELETIGFTIKDSQGNDAVDVNGNTVVVPDLTTTNVNDGKWISAGNGVFTYTITSLPKDTTYTVTEVYNDSAACKYSLITTGTKASTTSGSGTIVADGNVTVDLTNNYEPKKGNIVLTKTIYESALNEFECLKFEVTDSKNNKIEIPDLSLDNVRQNIWTDNGNESYTYTVSDLPANETYSVAEIYDGTTGSTGNTKYKLDSSKSIVNVDNVSITPNDNVDVSLSDTYTERKGTLVLTKSISNTALNKLETIKFKAVCSDGSELDVPELKLSNVGDGVGQWKDAGNETYTYTFTGLPADVTYTITEILDGHTANYVLDTANSTSYPVTSGAIIDGDTVNVTLTDAYTYVPTEGTLVVSKTISNTSLNELETISFTITDGDGKAVVDANGKTVSIPDLTTANVTAGTWTDAGNGKYTYTITDIAANTKCVVTETLDGHTSTYTLDTANSKTYGDATVTAGGTVYVELTDAYTKVEKKYDKEVKISKVDATNKKELAGCQLQLFTIDANGNQVSKANGGVFEEWTSSDSKVYTFKLTAGDYAIKELVAPEGYQKREDLYKFRLSFDDKGNAKITTLAGPGEYNEAEDRIEFDDDPIKVETETGGMKVTVQEEGTGRNVPNATVEIEAPSGTSFPDGSSKITVTTDENGQITSYKDKDGKVIDLTTGLTPGDYKVTVTKVPDGYKVTTGQTKTVTVKKGEVAEHLALIGTATKDDNTETKTEQPTTEKQPTTEVKQPSTTTTPNAPSTPQKDSTVVNTGDSMNVVPIIVVMILALIGIIVLIIKKRRMRYEY